jgi:CRP-like cAMP-binding protein
VRAEESTICVVLKKEAFVEIVGYGVFNQNFKEIEDFLRSTDSFKDCTPREIKMVATKVTPINHHSGDVLIEQGERPLRMYILKSGELSVKRNIPRYAIDKESIPGILRGLLQTLPDNLEIEVMTKSAAGDVCIFYEVMEGIESRYKINATIPSKLYYCSSGDLHKIFRGRDLSNLPL